MKLYFDGQSLDFANAIVESFGPSAEVATDMADEDTVIKPISIITAHQEGEGTASPTNVRNITGWDEATLTINDSSYETQSLGETVYGGEFDWNTGKLTITHMIFELNVSDMNNTDANPGWKNVPGLELCFENTQNGNLPTTTPCNMARRVAANMTGATKVLYIPGSTLDGLTQTDLVNDYSYLKFQMVVPLLEQRVVEFEPRQFFATTGENKFSSNCGDTKAIFHLDTKKYIDWKIQQALD